MNASQPKECLAQIPVLFSLGSQKDRELAQTLRASNRSSGRGNTEKIMEQLVSGNEDLGNRETATALGAKLEEARRIERSSGGGIFVGGGLGCVLGGALGAGLAFTTRNPEGSLIASGMMLGVIGGTVGGMGVGLELFERRARRRAENFRERTIARYLGEIINR